MPRDNVRAMSNINTTKVQQRVRARALADEYLKMALEEAKQLRDAQGLDPAQTFLHALRDALVEMLPLPPKPRERRPETAVAHVAAHCDEILRDVERMPEAAAAFAESSRTIVTGIRRTVIANNQPTASQRQALQNIHTGVLKWLR